MPPAKRPRSGLIDTWGRRNRTLPDYSCQQCGQSFHPRRAGAKYCSRPCMWANNGGHNRKDAPMWWKDSRGYISGQVWAGEKRRHVKQHRWLMEQHLGRPLEGHEDVHHINGDKMDNRIDNLRVMVHGTHSQHHNKGRIYKRGYTLDLTDTERQRRADFMRQLRREGRL